MVKFRIPISNLQAVRHQFWILKQKEYLVFI